MKKSKSLDTLKELFLEIHTYQSVLSLLHWDQETYMPQGANAARSQQISLLASLIHEKKTNRKMKQTLGKEVSLATGKIKAKGLSKEERVMLREWHKDYSRLNKLPSSHVKQFSQVTAEASQIWAQAKKQNNFKLFAPFLEKIVALCQKKAALIGYEDHPYDALLQHYEPCMTAKKLEALFAPLQKKLCALLEQIQNAKPIECDFLFKKVRIEKQKEVAHFFFSKLPIDEAFSRLDLSNHPFSTGIHPHDNRITTRILPNHLMSNILSVLHEVGHSLYEMGLPSKYWGTPIAESVSLSIHESQSRWWETLIGRSFPFWKAFYPSLQKLVPALFQKIPLKTFYKALNTVSPSLIRVEADEVSYCLHVILRFEIEKELISNELSVYDLPEAWNEKMKKYLGIIPPNDTQGCLQDIHWSLGDFGYFPTYALGNLFAAQFFSAFVQKHPDWAQRVEKKDLSFIREYLLEEIHQWGRTYTSEELIKRVTKKGLSEKAYCTYLQEKYSDIYSFKEPL